jgi:hypothetical protein
LAGLGWLSLGLVGFPGRFLAESLFVCGCGGDSIGEEARSVLNVENSAISQKILGVFDFQK